MTAPGAVCPSCGGPNLTEPADRGHPSGPIVFQHLMTCALLPREDSRRHADMRMAVNRGHPFDRTSTDVECALLAAVGLSIEPGDVCTVSLVSDAIPRRDFTTAVPAQT